MRTATFHVFSGTGNSLHLARAIEARLVEAGFATRLVELKGSDRGRGADKGSDPGPGDLDLFLFPVYAMSVPGIMERHMKRLGRREPSSGGARPRAAILSTNGRIGTRFRDGHEGQALAQAERVLARRGWDVAYRETLDYPQNITNFVPIQDEARKAAIMALAEPRIEAIARDLAAGVRHRRRCGPLFHLLGWPFGWLYRLIGRRAFAMLFAADGRCDGCGACARSCPAKAITMIRGRPGWSYACEGCERCINLCPKAAIQTSALRVALMALLWVLADACPLGPILLAAATGLGIPHRLAGAGWFAAEIALAFGAMRILDLLLLAIGFIPGLRPLLGFGWTRWFRRYKPPAGQDR